MPSLPTILPDPIFIDPASVPSLRWGIMGPGNIASVFAQSVHKHTLQRIVAVGSSSAGRAQSFSETHNIQRWYGNYDDLLGDSEVDVIYIATRQHMHREHALLAISAGKHVLIEKPLATTPEDAAAIRDAARSAGVFAMEALWTTYLPQSSVVRQLHADGVLGDIRFVQADLGQDQSAEARMFEPLGGGVSHDMGIYPMSFITSLISGHVEAVSAIGETSSLGVDLELIMHLRYANGARALNFSSMISMTPIAAWVEGSEAILQVEYPFPAPSSIILRGREFDAAPLASWSDSTGIRGHEGLSYQATAVASFIQQGLTESPWRNLDDSVRDIETLTLGRHAIGAFYPSEAANLI